jgi:hypothetical protein
VSCRSRNDFQWSESKIDVPLTLRNVAPMLERNEANPIAAESPTAEAPKQSKAKQSNAKQRKATQSSATQRNATQRSAAFSPVICSGEASR